VWLWPLPPPGPLTFVFTWAERGVAETQTHIDARELRDAVGQAEQLWAVDLAAPRPGGYWTSGGAAIATTPPIPVERRKADPAPD
jgi:hypothetical protein